MPAPFKASIITPEAIVLETSVTSAQVPAFDGLVGILDKRAPLLAKLATGVLTLSPASGGAQKFMVTGGYAQMKGDELSILTSEAIPAAQISQQTLAAETSKLNAIVGTDRNAMEQRQAQQARVQAMRSILA